MITFATLVGYVALAVALVLVGAQFGATGHGFDQRGKGWAALLCYLAVTALFAAAVVSAGAAIATLCQAAASWSGM